MRTVDLKTPRSIPAQQETTARLVRHLDARLRDFGPGGPEVVEADQTTGVVTARFPGHDTARTLSRLERDYGVLVGWSGDLAVFRLSPEVRFEDLDYVWGCLFELLF